MSYNITTTSGKEVVPGGLEENTTETIINNNGKQGGIILIGKLVAEYGEDQSNNFVRIIENFANDEAPNVPMTGMLWFDSNKKALNVCTNKDGHSIDDIWSKLLYIKKDSSSDSNTGDIFYNEETKEFYVYDENLNGTIDNPIPGWLLVGPSNYKHNIKNHYEAVTSSSSQTNSIPLSGEKKILDDDKDCSYLVTIKIVAREKYLINDMESTIEDRKPQTAAWIVTLLVERYKDIDTGDTIVEIVGNPNIQTIAKTNGYADNWGFNTIIDEFNDLKVNVYGTTGIDTQSAEQNLGNHIDWEIETEAVKV